MTAPAAPPPCRQVATTGPDGRAPCLPSPKRTVPLPSWPGSNVYTRSSLPALSSVRAWVHGTPSTVIASELCGPTEGPPAAGSLATMATGTFRSKLWFACAGLALPIVAASGIPCAAATMLRLTCTVVPSYTLPSGRLSRSTPRGSSRSGASRVTVSAAAAASAAAGSQMTVSGRARMVPVPPAGMLAGTAATPGAPAVAAWDRRR